MEAHDLHWTNVKDEVDDLLITQVEKQLGINFPADFVPYLKKYHGAIPRPNTFKFGDDNYNGYFGLILNLDPKRYESFPRLSLDMINNLEFQDGVVPFAKDAGGNLLCFDFSKDNRSPHIVYWYHEEDEYNYVCNTFEDLLKKLHE
ncbi:SMI1/KNR4 family protein [Mechercharimyces sp. CAU 1602]|uniref:SMI1/KNR4 family protein n=1 Tax=Mechercharimyces sp. CAU 1602 TaxID=2973933 RepID=UPI002163AAB4|nr:SMI1/KNR4 family protein [Mechercharimyces sp. CAU 1602]MCS1351679.1 SMI1/KNR4 family protein [Mechercharimyces sp. CAU 1602]